MFRLRYDKTAALLPSPQIDICRGIGFADILQSDGGHSTNKTQLILSALVSTLHYYGLLFCRYLLNPNTEFVGTLHKTGFAVQGRVQGICSTVMD